MKKRKQSQFIPLFLIVASVTWFSPNSRAAEVVNLKSYQKGRDIILEYTLKRHVSERRDSVTMKISLDNGRTWQKPKGIYGDVGKKVTVGSGKRITWSVLEDFPEGLDQEVIFRVEAAGEKRKGRPKVWIEPVTGIEFVWVPGGCYEMGQTEAGKNQIIREAGEKTYKKYYTRELPRHEVCVEGFWMGKYEVTNAQYRKYKASHDSKGYKDKSLNGDKQPAVYVSWEDGKDFVRWLERQNGGRFTFRLPAEAEWEYACRAGAKTARYWGDDPDDACRYANVHDRTSRRVNKFGWTRHNCDDGFAVTAPVGSFESNRFGLYDMLGNAWEWCEDIYSKDAYRKHQRNNPISKYGGSLRVLRGGSWSYGPGGVRCAGRGNNAPGGRNNSVGFRLVRTD